MTESRKSEEPPMAHTHEAPPPEILPELEHLKAQLAEAEQKATENWDKFLRTAAELENVRRRSERDIATIQKFALERALADLLGVCDSLELGLKAGQTDGASVKTVTEGLQLTHRQLLAFLEKQGVKLLDPAGQPFDPTLHEAVSMLESADVPPNHVLAVMQKGYKLHERLLRPAMVVVAKAPS